MPISSSTVFMTVWKALLGNGRFLSETDISMSFQDKSLFSRRNLKGEVKSQVYLCRNKGLVQVHLLYFIYYYELLLFKKVLAFRLIADGSVFSFSTKATTTQRISILRNPR